MSYNRYSGGGGGGGGGYNPGNSSLYSSPMPSAHQHQPQYGGYNRNPVWSVPPGPSPGHHYGQSAPPHGQGMSPWMNNSMPQQYRGGYGNSYDNRSHQNMSHMSRMNQGKRPMEWNSTPNKRSRIGGNLQHSQQLNSSSTNQSNHQQQQQKQKNQQLQNQSGATNGASSSNQQSSNANQLQQKKQWNNNKNRNFNNRRGGQKQKLQKQNQPHRKAYPVENVTVDEANAEQQEPDASQQKYFNPATGLICRLCDVFLRGKAAAFVHSKTETHQAKFAEAKAADEKRAAEKQAATVTEKSSTEAGDTKDGTKEETAEGGDTKVEASNEEEASTTEEANATTSEDAPNAPVADGDLVSTNESDQAVAPAESVALETAAESTSTEVVNTTEEESNATTTEIESSAEATTEEDPSDINEASQQTAGVNKRGRGGRGGRGRSRARGRR